MSLAHNAKFNKSCPQHINLFSALNTIMIIKCTVGSNLVPRVPGNEVERADDFITAKGRL